MEIAVEQEVKVQEIPVILTVKEVAKLMHVSERTVARMCEQGLLKHMPKLKSHSRYFIYGDQFYSKGGE